MSLSNEQKKHYRSIAHSLKPVVTIAGNGLSESVMTEIERALNDHELIKIKVSITDRDSRKKTIVEVCEQSQAELIQEIGKVAVILREAKKPNRRLSNLVR